MARLDTFLTRKAENRYGRESKYTDDNAYEDVIGYCLNRSKASKSLVGGVGLNLAYAPDQMRYVARLFNKDSGIRLTHFVISFNKKEHINTETAFNIAKKVADCIGSRYQILFAVHEDKVIPHIHFVFNNVSYIDGMKYSRGSTEYEYFIRSIDSILFDIYHGSLSNR